MVHYVYLILKHEPKVIDELLLDFIQLWINEFICSLQQQTRKTISLNWEKESNQTKLEKENTEICSN